MLEEVVITGQYEPQSLKKSVYQVRVVGPEIIRMRNATNVQGILNTELGMRFSSDLTLGTADVSLMGMRGQNVKILLDGVPLLDRGATRESLNQIDMNQVERIEIVEGPMSVVYGSDALAGVINIITKKTIKSGKPLAVSARILEETAGNEYSPFSGKGVHNESVYAKWQGKKFNAGAGITRNNFGGLQGNKEGRVKEWLPKEQLLGSGTLGYTNNKLNAWYRLDYLNEALVSAGAINTNTNLATDKEYLTDRYTHQLQAEWDISNKWSFNAVGSFQDYTRRTRTTLYDAATQDVRLSPEPGTQDEAKFNSTTLRGTFLYRMTDKLSFQPGFDLNFNKGAGERIDREREIGDYALFFSAEAKPFEFLNIRPGFRFIYNTVYDAPPVIPSVNIKAKLSSVLDLRAAYARGFRSPALRELYFYFFDSSHSIKGNPDLEAEYSNSYSTSLAWNAVTKTSYSYTATVGAFYNEFRNMIALGVDPENAAVTTYINISRYKTAGVTLNNAFSYKAWKASLGLAHIGVYNELSEDDTSLPEIMWTPEVNATVSYQFTKTGTSLSAFYKYTGKRSVYEYASGNIRLAEREEFHWLDFTAGQRITKTLNVSAGVKNLGNVTRLQNTSQDVGGAHSTGGAIPMSYGRSYFIALNFQLN
ncbi:MAG: TonB-dependent receptor [Cyclobacteriaceae bacterium]|nr:TonB-dependent receptor [Cyclobacteriaceae bacterium]